MLLFLDFDGVLRRKHAPLYRLEASIVERLAAVLREYPEVRIVVTSSWTDAYSLEHIRGLFPADIAARILGKTPRDKSATEHTRHREVAAYLRRLGVATLWVALDDDPLHYPKHAPLVPGRPRDRPGCGRCLVAEAALRERARSIPGNASLWGVTKARSNRRSQCSRLASLTSLSPRTAVLIRLLGSVQHRDKRLEIASVRSSHVAVPHQLHPLPRVVVLFLAFGAGRTIEKAHVVARCTGFCRREVQLDIAESSADGVRRCRCGFPAIALADMEPNLPVAWMSPDAFNHSCQRLARVLLPHPGTRLSRGCDPDVVGVVGPSTDQEPVCLTAR